MSLKDKIMADVKDAMKNKEQERLSTLRLLHSAIKNKEIEVRPNEVTDDDVLSVIKKSVKQRRDSIDQYEKANRSDLADKEKAELAILEKYMPEQLSADKVAEFVKESIAELGASSMKDMGAVMKQVMTKTKGAADNKVVSELVRSQLQ